MSTLSRSQWLYLHAAVVGASPERAAVATWESLERRGLITRKTAYTGTKSKFTGAPGMRVIHMITPKGQLEIATKPRPAERKDAHVKRAVLIAKLSEIQAATKSSVELLLGGMPPHEVADLLNKALERSHAR